MDIVFGTANQNKVREIQHVLPENIRILSLNDIGYKKELIETSPTIEGNAIQKVNQLWEARHLICFADDTGLEIEVLAGAPGVYSARYAGEQRNDEDNMDKVLSELGLSTNRNAQFRTVIAFQDGKNLRTFEGVCTGHIGYEKRGENGFGYDPIFIPDGETRTLAEMSMDEKNRISHRSKAIKKLVDYLNSSQCV